MVSLLLGEGAAVYARDDREHTPLHAASLKGHAAVVVLLAEGGAEIDAIGDRQFTPLHLACQNGYLDVASVLLDR